MNYQELKAASLDLLPKQAARDNANTALNKFQQFVKSPGTAIVGSEMLEIVEFERNVADICKELKSASTASNFRTQMRKWRKLALKIREDEELFRPEMSFAETLKAALERVALTSRVCAQRSGVSDNTLCSWVENRATPHSSSLGKIRRLEEILQLLPGLKVSNG